MNVPTLLTTIRLLMAHPNGDDGLMPDIVSRFPKHCTSRNDGDDVTFTTWLLPDIRSTDPRHGDGKRVVSQSPAPSIGDNFSPQNEVDLAASDVHLSSPIMK